MKTMTCKQLYGPCDALIHGETPEEMMENSKKHAMEMIAKGDELHIDAMNTIIRNGENGFLFNNEEEYIKIIKLLKKDKKLRESISNLALKEAYKRYQINKIAKEYLKIYKKLLFVPKQP